MKTKYPVAARRRSQSGFAMLLVFVMAASIAIFLYMQIPRFAFESQRDREELLIERGEQYKTAVHRYYVKFKRYPSSLEDLESTNNYRALRRRYVDPLTGKSDWKILHMGPGGLTDSAVQKATDPLAKDKDKDKDQTANANQGDPNNPQDPNNVNPAVRGRRPDVSANAIGTTPGGGTFDPNAPQDPNQVGQPGQPGAPIPGQQAFGQPGQPGSGQPGQPQYPGQPGFGQPGFGQAGSGQPGQPQYPGQGNPAYPGQPANSQAGQPGNPAADLINRMLTSPRQPPAGVFPGASDGTPVGGSQPGPGGQFGGSQPGGLINQFSGSPIGQGAQAQPGGVQGGIAGVASKYEGKGIKVYNDRQKYKEWEFVFDWRKDLNQKTGVVQLQNQNPLGGPGLTPGSQPAGPVGGPNRDFTR